MVIQASSRNKETSKQKQKPIYHQNLKQEEQQNLKSKEETNNVIKEEINERSYKWKRSMKEEVIFLKGKSTNLQSGFINEERKNH